MLSPKAMRYVHALETTIITVLQTQTLLYRHHQHLQNFWTSLQILAWVYTRLASRIAEILILTGICVLGELCELTLGTPTSPHPLVKSNTVQFSTAWHELEIQLPFLLFWYHSKPLTMEMLIIPYQDVLCECSYTDQEFELVWHAAPPWRPSHQKHCGFLHFFPFFLAWL